jgi:hypothetical protein
VADWESVNWGDLIIKCLVKNSVRFDRTPKGTQFKLPSSGASARRHMEKRMTTKPRAESGNPDFVDHTAVVVRTHWKHNYTVD